MKRRRPHGSRKTKRRNKKRLAEERTDNKKTRMNKNTTENRRDLDGKAIETRNIEKGQDSHRIMTRILRN